MRRFKSGLNAKNAGKIGKQKGGSYCSRHHKFYNLQICYDFLNKYYFLSQLLYILILSIEHNVFK